MPVYIVTVGDELLLGDTVNTNAAWLGQRLTDAGLAVRGASTVPDVMGEIVEAIRHAVQRASLVIVTGGLGPTHDDLTRDAVAEVFGKELEFHESWFRVVERAFASRGWSVPEANRSQAMVPSGFEIMRNDFGTAPGLFYTHDEDGREVDVAVLPGVPREMKHLVEDRLLARLGKQEKSVRAVVHIGTAGIGESHLQELLGDLSPFLDHGASLAYLPSLNGMRLRVTGTGSSQEAAGEQAAALVDVIDERAGRYVFSHNGLTLEAAVGQLLLERGMTVALAESCTGGRVADRLTNVPGSSEYVRGGVVAYCNSVKVAALGVQEDSLDDHGSVSEAVAAEMAAGVRERLGADIGLSSTGIMGPGGGTREKPVGTVWVGVSDARGTETRLLTLGAGREDNKKRAATAVLDLLRRRLIGI